MNLRKWFLVVAAVAMVFALTGCPGSDPTIPEPLAAPTGLEIAAGVLTWNAVAGARGYRVYSGDNEIGSTAASVRTFDLAEDAMPPLAVGPHQISVRALGVPGESEDSPRSAAIAHVVAEQANQSTVGLTADGLAAGTLTFPAAQVGTTFAVSTVTVTNTGTEPTGALTVVSSEPTVFAVAPAALESIPYPPGTTTRTFTVTPYADLTVGPHTATITVDGPGIAAATFTATITISAVPVVNPTAIEITTAGDATEIVQGGTLQFSYELVPGNADGTVNWSVIGETAATIDADGLLTVPLTVAPGTLTIRATATQLTSIYEELEVTVTPAPVFGINLTADGLAEGTLTFPAAQVGTTFAARTVTVVNTGNQPTGALTVVSSAPAVFAVAPAALDGIPYPPAATTRTFTVTPAAGLTVGPHTATITVDGDDITAVTFTATITISTDPIINPTAIDITTAGGVTAVNLGTGATLQLDYDLTPANATGTVDWTITGGTAIGATIDATTGLLSVPGTMTPGTVVVRATSTQVTTLYDEVTITVNRPVPTSFTVATTDATVISAVTGGSATFTATPVPVYATPSVDWSLLSDPTSATGVTIDAGGVLTVVVGASEAEWTVTATSTDAGATGTTTVTVYVPPPPPTHTPTPTLEDWQAVLASPLVTNRGGTIAATADGILISGRGTGEHDHNNGFVVDVVALRYGDTPVIVIGGTISGATSGNMTMQGMGIHAPINAIGSFTLTIPGDAAITDPWTGALAGSGGNPWLGSGAGMHGDILITYIMVGDYTIFEVLPEPLDLVAFWTNVISLLELEGAPGDVTLTPTTRGIRVSDRTSWNHGVRFNTAVINTIMGSPGATGNNGHITYIDWESDHGGTGGQFSNTEAGDSNFGDRVPIPFLNANNHGTSVLGVDTAEDADFYIVDIRIATTAEWASHTATSVFALPQFDLDN